MIIDITVTLLTATATATAVNDIAVTVVLNDEIINPEETFCERVDDCLDIPTANGNYVLKILNGVKSWIAESAGGGVWGSIIGTITNQTDLVNYITTRLTGYATEAFVTSQGYITNVITSLGYTPENVANKSDSYTVSSSTTYSSTKALVDGLATKQNSLGYTAENTANKSDSFTASSSTTYASTKALVDGLATRSLVLLSTATASNSSSIDFEVDYTVYKKYILEFTNVQSSVNYTDDLWLRVGIGSPVAYQSGATDYSWIRNSLATSTSVSAANTAAGAYSDTKIIVVPFLNNTGVYSVSGSVVIYNPSDSTYHKNIEWTSAMRWITAVSVVGTNKYSGAATYRSTSSITGLRIMSSTGNILTGTFKIYGVA